MVIEKSRRAKRDMCRSAGAGKEGRLVKSNLTVERGSMAAAAEGGVRYTRMPAADS